MSFGGKNKRITRYYFQSTEKRIEKVWMLFFFIIHLTCVGFAEPNTQKKAW